MQVGAERRVAGYTEASRGCKHRCRHCPIVPVYDGRFRIVPSRVVLADVRRQVAAGARHITFGDPDFFNGIAARRRCCGRSLAREFPGVTYDVTIKVEHLLQHADAAAAAARHRLPVRHQRRRSRWTTRCWPKLEKGHTRADFERAVGLCRDAGLTLAPTFVAFTPWTTLAGYCELLQTIESLDLVEHVAPIQLAIRLLDSGGIAAARARRRPRAGRRYSPCVADLSWRHRDRRVDALQRTVERMVGGSSSRIAGRVRAGLARARTPRSRRRRRAEPPPAPRAAIPYLNEPWYC